MLLFFQDSIWTIPSLSTEWWKYEIFVFSESPSIALRVCLAFSDHICHLWYIVLSLVQSKRSITLKPAAPEVTLRLPAKLSVLFSLRSASNHAVNLAVSLAMAFVICLFKAASLSWLRSLLTWWISQGLRALFPNAPSLVCSFSLSLFPMFKFAGDSG